MKNMELIENKYFENFKKLDEVYRVTEKEEIYKMKQLGKDPNEVIIE